MIRGLEFAGFVALAAAVHAGVWTVAPEGGGAGGDGGTETVTLAAAAPQMEALVAAWERPVEAQAEAPAPQPPRPPEAQPVALRPEAAPNRARMPAPPPAPGKAAALPRLPAAPQPAPALSDRLPAPLTPRDGEAALAQRPRPEQARPDGPRPDAPEAPPLAAPPQIDRQAAEAPAPVRPVARPARKPAQPAPARPEQTARGTGRQEAGGTNKAHAAARLDAATRASLMGQWGGAIRARIERQKRYPAGTRAQGTVHLVLDVGGDGRLLGVAVTRSSGDARLDAAALAAVRRARLPAKPERLPGPRHRFSLPMAFAR
ncbi:MAG: hypothetical protein CMN17_02455 [Roseovarius sp.]|nr:hypothetical protein [Roseovarius sp.]MBK43931.1 hypothetical protein [Roseovarius sp.]